MTRLRQRGGWLSVGGTTVAFAALQALPAALAAYRTGSIHPALIAITVANVAVLATVA